MRRIAWVSPLPPESSGVADYSAELLPSLARHFDLELFCARPRHVPASLRTRFATRSYSALRRLVRRGRYDAVLYQLGNSATFHGPIYRLLLDIPGVVVLHEHVLHHLVKELTLERGGLAAFVEEMRYCYGGRGASVARGLLESESPPDAWSFPLFERVVDSSLAILTHSETARRRVLASRPRARIAVVPHHLSLDGLPEGNGRAFRRALGIDDDALVVGTFGFVTPPKRLDVCLRAFARLRAAHPRAVYLVVGEVSPRYPEIRELTSGELAPAVRVTGRVSRPEFLAAMRATDIALNLRHPSGGETSGTCVRLLGMGRPVVVTDEGWFSEIPDGCCAKVETGPDEEEILLAVLGELAARPELRRAMGEAAREWTSTHHDLEVSARGYAALLDSVIETRPALPPVVPPLARPERGDVATALIAEISKAATDLGLGEEDPLVDTLAETVVDLDVDVAGRPRGPRLWRGGARSSSTNGRPRRELP